MPDDPTPGAADCEGCATRDVDIQLLRAALEVCQSAAGTALNASPTELPAR